MTLRQYDVLVLGAGAAGMMCAIEAGKRGRSVMVLDHAEAVGEKIRISGGGRCNFTNLETRPDRFLSQNPRFCISALSRYTQADFVKLVEAHRIAYHEKTLGQLFCDGSAREVIAMLTAEMAAAKVEVRLKTSLQGVEKTLEGFRVETSAGTMEARSLVVATGGKSIPKMGATGLGYDLARQFGLRVTETRPALVPLTLEAGQLARYATLAGVSVDTEVRCGKTRFREAMLFTHRGLSGPAILQISSYWREGEAVTIDMAPGVEVFARLSEGRRTAGKRALATAVSDLAPRRLAELLCGEAGPRPLADAPDRVLKPIAEAINAWTLKPVGSEGYRTAEVTLGGVDTRDLDSRTMQARAVPGLYFVGEVVDVTGWLGGYNFQWAWSSGWCAGQAA